jgi:DUF1680 family protein
MDFKMHLRLPTWVGDQLVPGALYQYTQPSAGWTLSVNGEKVEAEMDRGFLVLDRTWKPGDCVVLNLPMPLKANRCIDLVEANRDRVAFSRGPLVLCAEGADNGDPVQRFFVDPFQACSESSMSIADSGILTGLPLFTIPARESDVSGSPKRDLALIPYFAWSNRDRSSMMTWIPAWTVAGNAGHSE